MALLDRQPASPAWRSPVGHLTAAEPGRFAQPGPLSSVIQQRMTQFGPIGRFCRKKAPDNRGLVFFLSQAFERLSPEEKHYRHAAGRCLSGKVVLAHVQVTLPPALAGVIVILLPASKVA